MAGPYGARIIDRPSDCAQLVGSKTTPSGGGLIACARLVLVRRFARLDHDERLPLRHFLSRAAVDLADDAVLRRLDQVLHLHRLDHDERQAGVDVIADRDTDLHHDTGHRSAQGGGSRTRRDGRCSRARSLVLGLEENVAPSLGAVQIEERAAAADRPAAARPSVAQHDGLGAEALGFDLELALAELKAPAPLSPSRTLGDHRESMSLVTEIEAARAVEPPRAEALPRVGEPGGVARQELSGGGGRNGVVWRKRDEALRRNRLEGA